MSPKKIPSIADQVKASGLDGWARGETRLRTTIVSRDGASHTARMTRPELEEKQLQAKAFQGIRASLDLTQPDFARLIHATPAAVRQWEQARRAIPAPVLALAELARDIPAVRARLEATAARGPVVGSAFARRIQAAKSPRAKA